MEFENINATDMLDEIFIFKLTTGETIIATLKSFDLKQNLVIIEDPVQQMKGIEKKTDNQISTYYFYEEWFPSDQTDTFTHVLNSNVIVTMVLASEKIINIYEGLLDGDGTDSLGKGFHDYFWRDS